MWTWRGRTKRGWARNRERSEEWKDRLTEKDRFREKEREKQRQRQRERQRQQQRQTETKGDNNSAEERKRSRLGESHHLQAPSPTLSCTPSGTLYWTQNPGLEDGTPELGGPILHLPGYGASGAQNPTLEQKYSASPPTAGVDSSGWNNNSNKNS